MEPEKPKPEKEVSQTKQVTLVEALGGKTAGSTSDVATGQAIVIFTTLANQKHEVDEERDGAKNDLDYLLQLACTHIGQLDAKGILCILPPLFDRKNELEILRSMEKAYGMILPYLLDVEFKKEMAQITGTVPHEQEIPPPTLPAENFTQPPVTINVPSAPKKEGLGITHALGSLFERLTQKPFREISPARLLLHEAEVVSLTGDYKQIPRIQSLWVDWFVPSLFKPELFQDALETLEIEQAEAIKAISKIRFLMMSGVYAVATIRKRKLDERAESIFKAVMQYASQPPLGPRARQGF